MTAGLSRRGLFRAFRQEAAGEEAAETAMLARISAACVEPRGVMCRRCGDECEVRAISFRLIGAGKAQVSVGADACTGCGDCLKVCPVGAIELISRDRAALIGGLVELGAAS